LIISQNQFPTNRPILNSLWNIEFVNRGNKVTWLMSSRTLTSCIVKSKWLKSDIFLVPKISVGKNRLIDFFTDIWTKFKVYKFISKQSEIDIVHFHDTSFHNLIGFYAKFIDSRKLSLGYTAPFIDMKKALADKSKGVDFFLRKVWYFLFRVIYMLSFSTFDYIFPISNSLGKRIKTSYFINESKIMTVSESASKKFLDFDRTEANHNSKLKIVYAGSMRNTRKLDFLLDSFNMVLREIPEVELDMIGWSEFDEDVISLKSYSNKLGIGHKVNFLGKQSYENMPHLIGKCSVGVSPIPPEKYFLEATPTKVIEYLSLGIPVVSNKEIYDQDRIVTESNGGISVKYKRSSFSKAIIRLIKNPASAKQMGLKGKSWIIKNRTFERTAELIEAKFKSSL